MELCTARRTTHDARLGSIRVRCRPLSNQLDSSRLARLSAEASRRSLQNGWNTTSQKLVSSLRGPLVLSSSSATAHVRGQHGSCLLDRHVRYRSSWLSLLPHLYSRRASGGLPASQLYSEGLELDIHPNALSPSIRYAFAE